MTAVVRESRVYSTDQGMQGPGDTPTCLSYRDLLAAYPDGLLTAVKYSADGRLLQYMVFACADSRVCPSVTLRLEPGEAFTIRNIAAMVPPYDKSRYAGIGSAIEYAVCALKVEVLVVIGHSKCGGIKALLSLQDGAPDTFHFVEDWVRIGYPAKKKVQTDCASLSFDDQCSALEKEAVNVSLENLKTYPFAKEGLANGTLKLIGGHYDFVNGVFITWQPK